MSSEEQTLKHINKQVHKALGHCVHEWVFLKKSRGPTSKYYYRCKNYSHCGADQFSSVKLSDVELITNGEIIYGRVLNYASDPSLWWSLVERIKVKFTNVSLYSFPLSNKIMSAVEIGFDDYRILYRTEDIDPGVAVCKAFLEVMNESDPSR